jgi:hypothetical protein
MPPKAKKNYLGAAGAAGAAAGAAGAAAGAAGAGGVGTGGATGFGDGGGGGVGAGGVGAGAGATAFSICFLACSIAGAALSAVALPACLAASIAGFDCLFSSPTASFTPFLIAEESTFLSHDTKSNAPPSNETMSAFFIRIKL